MKIYDSLSTKMIELDDPIISIYNCGPTVYNHVHIGNVRPLITFDVLFRFLTYLKKEVKYVQNITDIDDKIINEAKKQNIHELKLSHQYFLAYQEIMKKLNIKPMFNPKISDHLEELIQYINKVLQTGYAYEVDGDVYFDVTKLSSYGVLSKQNIDQLLANVRKENKTNKKNVLDFALWKKTNEGIKWDSPWSQGRPGWHSECSFLIDKYIGKQVTIHGGGIDLKFPHHENENAQNLALNHCHIAKIWMHIGHINVNAIKMSKSLNNFILVKDLLEKYQPNVLRWFMYQTQYQNPLNFTEDLMNQTQNDLNKLFKSLNLTYINAFIFQQRLKIDSNASLSEQFIQALENDLNLPNALSNIYQMTKSLNQTIRNKDFSLTEKTFNQIIKGLEILGIKYEIFNNDKQALDLLKDYKTAYLNKEYDKADLIREMFQQKAII